MDDDIQASEAHSLDFLSDMQAELHDALSALGGKHGEGLYDFYMNATAGHINRAVEGYIFLRTSRRIDASKHLIRNAIEAAVRVHAVRKKPDLLFRIAFREFNEEKKWVRSTAQGDASAALSAVDKNWTDFKQAYRAKYPEHTLVEKEMSLEGLAVCAGIKPYYDTHYRLYCRFTHAAFRATTGNLNQFEREDNHTMALCALAAMEALSSIGAPTPNIESFRERLSGKP